MYTVAWGGRRRPWARVVSRRAFAVDFAVRREHGVRGFNPYPTLFPSDGKRTCYASGEALRGLGDRSRATTVELWIGTTEIRPILITARRRAPARQPGTAPMSTV